MLNTSKNCGETPEKSNQKQGFFKRLQQKELHLLGGVVGLLFAVFLVLPLALVIITSFTSPDGSGTLSNYLAVFGEPDFLTSIVNSLKVAATAGLVTVLLAFLLAYTVNCTNLPRGVKKVVTLLSQMPMLLPTITYGFAIIYTFGRQGLFTRLLGFQPFDIYGFNGLLIGYVIYTLPTAFLLINNSFQFIDKRYIIVSRIMGDKAFTTFLKTIVRPLAGAICTAFVLSFFLSFTDYGIPTSVGGTYNVVALELYNQMLGALPNFNQGAVVAVAMLIPSFISIAIMALLERHAIRYDNISPIEIPRGRLRDAFCGISSTVVLAGVLSVFAVIMIVPFVDMWPFKMTFTLDHITSALGDTDLMGVLINSLIVATATAIFGCIIAYIAALVTARSTLPAAAKRGVDAVSSVINAVPGMVLGVAYLFAFSGGPLQGTFVILIVCNIVHYFATPYQMMKDSLTKMNSSWETTAKLMGDSWLKTVIRVVTPNAWPTLLQVFGYYFVNAMVTISAVVFLTGAHTMVITTKISALQHVADFESIFVLSLLILTINLAVKGAVALATRPHARAHTPQEAPSWHARLLARLKRVFRNQSSTSSEDAFTTPLPENTPRYEEELSKINHSRKRRHLGQAVGGALLLAAGCFVFVNANAQAATSLEVPAGRVVIYSNADSEALDAYKNALDTNGFAGRYLIQSFGTSELGGRLLAEGNNIEADVVTMSSYYLDSAQQKQTMFQKLGEITSTPLKGQPSYRAVAQAQEGALFYNTEILKAENLPLPTSLKDLADPLYEGMISLPDISGSSTGWLLMQTLIGAYGEDEARAILVGLYRNAGPYLSQSGSAPIKNVRAGEVALGFGLRHQALADKTEGLPIDFIDPAEGSYSLTESVAVVDKGDRTHSDAQKMAAVIIDAGRPELMETYSKPLYVSEMARDGASPKPREFAEILTVDLLERHRAISEACKQQVERMREQ